MYKIRKTITVVVNESSKSHPVVDEGKHFSTGTTNNVIATNFKRSGKMIRRNVDM